MKKIESNDFEEGRINFYKGLSKRDQMWMKEKDILFQSKIEVLTNKINEIIQVINMMKGD